MAVNKQKICIINTKPGDLPSFAPRFEFVNLHIVTLNSRNPIRNSLVNENAGQKSEEGVAVKGEVG